MKRVMSIILVLSLALSTLAGCSKNQDKENGEVSTGTSKVKEASGESKTDDKSGELSSNKGKWHVGKEVVFDWYLNYSWWKHNKEWKEYPVLKEISDITGVTPNVSIPSGDGTEKLNLMIATNSLPDMITLDITDRNVNKLVSQGLVYSYNELMDEYCKEFKEEIPAEIYKYNQSDIDGKLYGLPSWFVPDGMPNNASAYNVRNEFYKAIGSPDMSTLEGFKSALVKFKEMYPTVDGKVSIPLSLGKEYGDKKILERSFGIREFYEKEDGTLQHRYKDPRYVNVVKFINELYREGLLDQEGYVKKSDQIKEDRTNRVFCAATGWWGLKDENAALRAKNQDDGYVVVEPMGADGEKFESGQFKLGWTTSLITKKAKNPGEILKFTRYLWSPEGNKLLMYGHEGEDFTVENNNIVRSESFTKKWLLDPTKLYEDTGIYTFRFFQYSYWDNALYGAMTESKTRAANRALANSYVTYDNTPYRYKMNPDPTTEEGIIRTQVDEIEKKEYAKIIMAPTEAEAVKAYENMIKKMNKVGLEKYENWLSDKYKNNVEKFK